MDERSLAQLFTRYPKALESAGALRSYLLDLFPTEKNNINAILAAYNSGVFDMIRNSSLDSVLISRIISVLCSDCNMKREKANWVADILYTSYGVQFLGKSVLPNKTEKVSQEGSTQDTLTSSNSLNGESGSNSELDKFLADIEAPKNFGVNKGRLEFYNRTLKILNIPDFVTYIPEGHFCDEHIGDFYFKNKEGFFEDNQNIEEASIPATIRTVGKRTFQNCKQLRSVEFHDGLKEIGENAFLGCSVLKKIYLPDTLERIDIRAFSKCDSLESIAIPGSVTWIRDGAFENCRALKEVIFKSGDSDLVIGDTVFDGCDSLSVITIGKRPLDSIIRSSIFSSNQKLTQINIPNEAFEHGYCIIKKEDRLKLIKCEINRGTLIRYIESPSDSIHFPPEVRRITENSFVGGVSTQTIVIGSQVEEILPGAFRYISNLKSIAVVEDNSHYCALDGVLYTADGKTLVSYPSSKGGDTFVVPDGVNRIAPKAFVRVRGLKNLFFPDSVKEIADNAIIEDGFFFKLRNVRYPKEYKVLKSNE